MPRPAELAPNPITFAPLGFLPLLWAGSLTPLRLFDLSRPSSACA
jgi:hypothetical protein